MKSIDLEQGSKQQTAKCMQAEKGRAQLQAKLGFLWCRVNSIFSHVNVSIQTSKLLTVTTVVATA